ncbi:MAG TPA: hypothetical protein VIQ98_01980, partial [Gemmatimonadales bacterium]
VEPMVLEVDRREAQALRELELGWRQATGQRTPPRRVLTAVETELAALRPALAAGPREFLTGRGEVAGVPGLHGYMGPEIASAVNGKRSGIDIYRFIAAEAREAGDHYFGVVTAEAVLQYLRNLEGARLVRLR